MTRIALVADKRTATCFKLAGLRDVYHVESAEEAEKCVRALLEKSDITVVLITQRIVDQIDSTMKRIAESKYPVIIPIPDTKGPIRLRTDPIVELIKRKTGIEIKLQ